MFLVRANAPASCHVRFMFSVTGCDAFFKIRYRLREHMRSHTQERLVACPTCGSMFSSNTKLFDHLHRQAEPVGESNTSVSQTFPRMLMFLNALH